MDFRTNDEVGKEMISFSASLSDFHKMKIAKEKDLRRQYITGGVFILLAVSILLSFYSLYSVQQLTASINNEREGRTLAENLKSINSHSKPCGEHFQPVMFDCTRTSRLQNRGIVTYDVCLVDLTEGSMNISSGIFSPSEKQTGIYQISFTAKYVANSNGRFGAWSDILVDEVVIADSQREYNGNNGRSRTESSTHTMLALYPLKESSKVKIMFNKDGQSYIHSDNDHDVHFIVRKIAELPGNQM